MKVGRPPIDISNQRFGRSVALEYVGNHRWKCKCDCGNEFLAYSLQLRKGVTQSCGCLVRERLIARSTKHGQKGTRLYRIWKGMRNRCGNPAIKDYLNYGGRGIEVCKEWQNDFVPFYEWSISHGYQDTLTIDRIDNDKGYSPDNCRWVDWKYQGRNKRNNYLIEFRGETKSLSEWSEITGINRTTIKNRIERGWSVERALTTRR